MDTDANTDPDARGSAIALPGLHPGELKSGVYGSQNYIGMFCDETTLL